MSAATPEVSDRRSRAVTVNSLDDGSDLTTYSHGGAHALANLDLLREDPMSFIYAWRGTAVLFSFTWTLIIAVCVAVVEWAPGITAAYVLNWKYNLLINWVEEAGWGPMFGFNLLISLGCGLAATACSYIGGPGVPGSGLPELISFCSCGYTMEPQFFSLKTMIFKNLSMTFVLVAGVCVGREGPAIAIGAATAHMVGKMLNMAIYGLVQSNPRLNETLSQLSVGDFSGPFSGQFMHEIVHIGASSGFACAFYAPIGGALFVYEEVASHWTQHQEMTSRVLFGVAISVALDLSFSNAFTSDAHTLYESIVIYDRTHFQLDLAWHYADAPFYTLMAIYIGLQVGILSKFALWCSKVHDSMNTVPKKVGLYMLLVVATCLLMSAAPAVLVRCHDMPNDTYYDSVTGVRRFIQFNNCPDGEYNEMASLTLATSEDAIKHLFSRDDFIFSLSVLLLYNVIYSLMFSCAMGSWAAAGNFTPNVVMGAVVGRFFGHLAQASLPGRVSAPGVYAVVGATCQLVSWTRAIPAVVVTMFEVTSDTSNVIPMLIFSMLSRSITNLFGLDGWAHSVFHENASLPKHKVRPQYWRDNETLPAEDRKVFDHGHGHGGNRSDEVVEDGTGGGGGVRHHADKNDRSSHTRMSIVDGRMTMVNPDRRLSRNLTVHSENPMHGDSDDKIPESHL